MTKRETIEEAYQRGRRDMAKEVFALAEDTIDRFSADGKEGHELGYARGQYHEAKSFAKAINAIL